LTADVLTPVRNEIAQSHGLSRDGVMVVCTHTHSGPDTLRLFPRHPPEEYFRQLHEAIVHAADEAFSRLQPARVGVGKGAAPGISINRRTFERGPLDTGVGVLRVEDERHRPLALVVNFACHPVALGGDNLLLSADFPGYAMALLEQADPGCLALYVNGAFGNVNTGHRADIDVGDRGERTFERARALGHILAGEVLKVHNAISCRAEAALRSKGTPVALRTRDLPAVDLGELRAKVAKAREIVDCAATPMEERVKAQCNSLYDYGMLCLKESLPAVLETQVVALRVGDAVFAGVPAEYFIEYQIALKKESPHPFTFLAAPANDWIGYVPTPEAFAEGGYETRTCPWSKLAPECGDLLYAKLLEAVSSL